MPDLETPPRREAEVPVGRSDRETKPGFFDWWLAPLVLCGIALLQISLAHTVDLSPWKGGGFGMFSTVDAPDMRIISGEGVDDLGENVRVDPFEIMSESDRLRWRSWPNSGHLERLFDRMWSTGYVVAGTQWTRALKRLKRASPEAEIPIWNESDGWVRPTRSGDPEGVARALRALRIRAWKLRYEAGENRLVSEPMGEVVERGEWP